MVYTIQIDDNAEKAKNLISMLKVFKNDYNFIEIHEDNERAELESRYEAFQKNMHGKSWYKLKSTLI